MAASVRAVVGVKRPRCSSSLVDDIPKKRAHAAPLKPQAKAAVALGLFEALKRERANIMVDNDLWLWIVVVAIVVDRRRLMVEAPRRRLATCDLSVSALSRTFLAAKAKQLSRFSF